MRDSASKEQAHLKRAAYYDSRGNTPKALAHFGRALYFGGKRRTNDDLGKDEPIPKRQKLSADVEKSLTDFRNYEDEISAGLGSMRVGGGEKRMSAYGR